MSRLGTEPWQDAFHDRWERDQEKRNASAPDPGDWALYYGDHEEEYDE